MKIARRISLLVGLSLLLTGCITQQTETILRTDGSGTQAVRIGLSRQFLDLASMGGQSSVDPGELLSEIGAGVSELPAEWEAVDEPWESADQQYTGTRINLRFSDPGMLEDQLGEGVLDPATSLVAFDDVSVREEDGTYVIRATIVSASGAGDLDLGAGFGNLQNSPFGNTLPTASWRIEMPGEILEWSEQELGTLEGNAVSYNFPFPLERPYQIVVRARARPGVSRAVLISGGLLLLGLATLLAGVLLNRRNRRAAGQPVPLPAGPAPAPTQQWASPPPERYAPPAPAPTQQWASPPPERYAPPAAAAPAPEAYDSPRMPTRPLGGWMDEPHDRPRD